MPSGNAHAHTLALVLLTVSLMSGCTDTPTPAQEQAPRQYTPHIEVDTVLDGLREPWDIAFAPDGAMLFTEKCHGLSVRLADGEVRRLFGNDAEFALRADDLFCQGQSGVHGVAVDPQFGDGRRFVYVFGASRRDGDAPGNHVIRLEVAQDWSGVGGRTDIVRDIAYKSAPEWGGLGAHSGGRLRFGPDGYLYVGTGDNHSPTLPQDPRRLGGKVLRVDRDGRAAEGNAVPESFDARIYTWGHRNVQGIAFRPPGQPGAGQAFAAEHGPNHSDEITPLVPGGNGGWDPQDRPDLRCIDGYCGYSGDVHTMPMTDIERFPDAMPPAWTNGDRSEGMGPVEFLDGPHWGAWDGRLAVALMGARRLDVLILDESGMGVQAQVVGMPPLRLRSLVQGPDGALWATTDEGELLRIVPQPG